VTAELPTVELPKEARACITCHAKNVDKAVHTPTSPMTGSHLKTLNLTTYKFHAMGDYPAAIHQFGMIDSTSTQHVSIHISV